MNMNDAFVGSLIFNKNSGGGGGETSLEFTKTSILDKTQMTNNTITLTTEYTNYPFLLFSFTDTADNVPIDALVPTAMITETFSYSGVLLCIQNPAGNHTIRYSKSSNTLFTVYDGSYMSLVDVYGVNVNKSFTTDVIYSRGRPGESAVTVSHNNILDNDLIFLSSCWNGDVDFSNRNFICNIPNIKGITTKYQCSGALSRRFYGTSYVLVTDTSISSAVHYMVLGIKFT